MPESLLKALLVGIGGGLGSVSRYGLAGVAERILGAERAHRFPLGTLSANVLGCLFAGFLAYLFIERQALHPHHRLLLMTGFLGGLTTFSSFGFETIQMSKSDDWILAGLNIAANLIFSLGAVWVGWATGRALWG